MPAIDDQTDVSPITAADLRTLMHEKEGPCVSIYIHTAAGPDADQGRIRFKSAVKEAERALHKHKDPGQREQLLEPLRALEDGEMWLSQRPALAVFRAPGHLWLRRIPREVEDQTVVADSYHVKPLIRLVQHAARYQLLCVSSERVALYEGDRDRLEPVALHPDVPTNMAQALGEPDHVTREKKAANVPPDSDTRDRQLKRYFQRIDPAVWEHHSRPTGLPLILAALPEYHTFFHDASDNPQLAEVGVRRHPFKDIDRAGLGALAWEVVEADHDKKLAALRERYGEAAAHHQGVDQVNEVARQAVFGKIDTLLLQEDQRVGGTIDPGTGEVSFKTIGDPRTDDLLDDIAEIVLRNRGRVLVLPRDQMPTDNGVAAILRYQT